SRTTSSSSRTTTPDVEHRKRRSSLPTRDRGQRMSTMSIALSRPAEIALVTADAVEEVVEREFLALQELERAAIERCGRAAEYERHLMVERAAPAIAAGTLIGGQQYIERLGSRADDDTAALLGAARRQAKMTRRGMLPAPLPVPLDPPWPSKGVDV